ncbi:hypothetical protein AB870_26415 [Pandoraea faecigallinarum]|nr:hypothetical protein AB870_26415 [Pandoraea faecigallinarum]
MAFVDHAAPFARPLFAALPSARVALAFASLAAALTSRVAFAFSMAATPHIVWRDVGNILRRQIMEVMKESGKAYRLPPAGALRRRHALLILA